MKLLAWGLTDVGQKREHNEDAFLVNTELGLFAVADGMGGHAGGDQASRMAIEIIEQEIRRMVPFAEGSSSIEQQSSTTKTPAAQALRSAARKAGEIIFDIGEGSPTLAGMGTTLTALFVYQDHAYLAHVGDSRAYLFRNDQFKQLTEDHSWIEEQVKAGFMTPAEAQGSSLKHIITRSVGFEREVEVDLVTMPVMIGDCYFLCSDGLSNHITAAEIKEILSQHPPAEVLKILIQMANQKGGDDNITGLLVCMADESAEGVSTIAPPEPAQ